jgi:hypothetical protein
MGVNQAPAALTLLHEHITSKRSRNVPIASLEPVMLLLVELSVEQKKGKLAKDALYQYKNISQNTNVATIEVCFLFFLSCFPAFLLTRQPACTQEIHRARRRQSHSRPEEGG